MNDPQGTIVAITRTAAGVRAIVDVEAGVACARCASGRGCGAGVLSGRARNSRLEVLVDPDLELAEGDVVGIELPSRDVLGAALTVYGLPLAGAIFGAAFAYLATLGDGGSAALAIGGLCLGVIISRRRLRDASCLARFTPTVSRRVGPDV